MTRIEAIWTRIRESLWLIPTLMTLLAVGLAYETTEVDRRLVAEGRAAEHWFVFSAGAAGARGTLSAIATSVITVTGVVFSVTIVALQLASSQFTPRVLRMFMVDRANQIVLGVFIATFTYALMIARSVRAAGEDVEVFVPAISVTVAIGFALASIAALIFFINHIARSIRASVILDRVTSDALELVEKLFPEVLGWPAAGALAEEEVAIETQRPRGRPWLVTASRSGYLEAVDEEALSELADEGRFTIAMERGIGDFVLRGEPLAAVWRRDGRRPERVVEKIRAAFLLGPERTMQQDVERLVVELVDIAVRALSPSVNDPTTAMECIDHLAEVLMELGNRRFPTRWRVGADGRVVFLARRITYDGVVELAFDQIRHYAAKSPQVVTRLLDATGRVAERVPPFRRIALVGEAVRVRDSALHALTDPIDRDRVERAAARAFRSILEAGEEERAGGAARGTAA